jgi:hypothetical protein
MAAVWDIIQGNARRGARRAILAGFLGDFLAALGQVILAVNIVSMGAGSYTTGRTMERCRLRAYKAIPQYNGEEEKHRRFGLLWCGIYSE